MAPYAPDGRRVQFLSDARRGIGQRLSTLSVLPGFGSSLTSASFDAIQYVRGDKHAFKKPVRDKMELSSRFYTAILVASLVLGDASRSIEGLPHLSRDYGLCEGTVGWTRVYSTGLFSRTWRVLWFRSFHERLRRVLLIRRVLRMDLLVSLWFSVVSIRHRNRRQVFEVLGLSFRLPHLCSIFVYRDVQHAWLLTRLDRLFWVFLVSLSPPPSE